MVKNIIFDFGAVLVDWKPEYLYRDYFNDDEKMNRFFEEIELATWNPRFDCGLPFAKGIEEWKEAKPLWAKEIAMFWDRWTDMLGDAIEGMPQLLKDVKMAGFGMYGLTNWSGETIDFAYNKFAFFSILDGVVVSGQEHLLKPDYAIYRTLLHRYNLKAEECLFIDDNAANVQAARELGINAIQFTDAAAARRAIFGK